VARVYIISTTQVDSPILLIPDSLAADYGDQAVMSGFATFDDWLVCNCDCTCSLPVALSAKVAIRNDQGSVDPPLPVMAVFTMKEDHDVPDRITARLRVEDKEGQQIYSGPFEEYTTEGFVPGDSLRHAPQAQHARRYARHSGTPCRGAHRFPPETT